MQKLHICVFSEKEESENGPKTANEGDTCAYYMHML